MADTQARFILSIQGSQLEVAGSEDFVEKQVQRFALHVENWLAGASKESLDTPQEKPADEAVESEPRAITKSITLESLENVFALADDKIQILKDLPGSGKSPKTVSAALLTAYGNFLRGTDETPFDTIRDMCEAHGCLDSGNFSKTISNEKELFIVTGTERKKTVRLNVPGKRKAELLAKELND